MTAEEVAALKKDKSQKYEANWLEKKFDEGWKVGSWPVFDCDANSMCFVLINYIHLYISLHCCFTIKRTDKSSNSDSELYFFGLVNLYLIW